MRQWLNPFTGKMQDFPPPRKFLCPESGRPTRDFISTTLGVAVPLKFVEFVDWIYSRGQGDPYECSEAFEEALGMIAVGPEARYESTPPELIPFAVPGVDGLHFGLVVLAPELSLDESPIGYFCPMDSDGVVVEGRNTIEGLLNIASCWAPKGNMADWSRLQSACIDTKRMELSIAQSLFIPAGWRHELTSDGIGVLAPSALFGNGSFPKSNQRQPLEAVIASADESIRQKHWAAALFHLREGYWNHWTRQPLAIAERLCVVYEKLDRPEFAKIFANRILEWNAQ